MAPPLKGKLRISKFTCSFGWNQKKIVFLYENNSLFLPVNFSTVRSVNSGMDLDPGSATSLDPDSVILFQTNVYLIMNSMFIGAPHKGIITKHFAGLGELLQRIWSSGPLWRVSLGYRFDHKMGKFLVECMCRPLADICLNVSGKCKERLIQCNC